jgi:hypothetical protein
MDNVSHKWNSEADRITGIENRVRARVFSTLGSSSVGHGSASTRYVSEVKRTAKDFGRGSIVMLLVSLLLQFCQSLTESQRPLNSPIP